MTEKGFVPMTGQLGISGTSYRIQLGLINDKWASRILKGKDVLDSYVFKDAEVGGEFPNANYVVGWVLRTVAIPNINPHQIMKTTQALLRQAMQKKQEKQVKAPIEETKKVELEKVPENQLRRPKQAGWVKEEGVKTQKELEDEKRQAFKQRMEAKKAEESKASSANTVKTSRSLPSIPGGTPKPKTTPEEKEGGEEEKVFCPYCGKDLTWIYCPYCGKKLPH
ncbi:MAG: hypothetical protein GF353_21125 [Candidatus Lokiarchaeota archaeon]|nr:hypothetical protein [Candidatus Lokiarchaeota archaeon]